MKINSRNFLIASLTMIVMMVAILFSAVTISPLVAHAASGTGTENDPYVVTTYAELRDLMANAPTDGTTRYIKLGGDITSSDSNNDYALTLTNANQNVVLDLAGYTISRSPSVTLDETIVRAKEGTLTINDSVGTGGISSNNNYINSVIGLMADGLYNDNGTIIINGGTYTVDVSSSITSYAVYQARGNLVINGGKFTGGYGLDSVSGKLTVYGGEFYTTKYAAILLASITSGNLYNLTAYGDVRAQSGYNLWNFIHDDGEVFVDGVKQAKTETTKFSGNKIEIKSDVLDEIWITATAPVVGNSIPNSIDVPYTSDYEIVEEYGNQVIAWMVDGQPVNAATFAASTAYTLRAYVKVNAPTAFNFGAKVNGQPASLEFEVETMEGYKYYWVEYTFPATIDNVIPSANVTVTAPVAGETATGGKIFNSEKYNVSIGWSTTADGSAANDFNNQTFVAGNTYYVDVYLVAENPYIFADGATVFVNGTSYTSVWTNGADYKKYVAVYDIPFTVPNAETYTVSFNANGGTGSMLDETDQLGGLVLPECGFTAPTGKQFKCWAEGSTSGAQYAPGEEYDVTGDVTFFAIWEDNEVIYSYCTNGAEGSNEMGYATVGEEITLADCMFTAPEGKQFKAWAIGGLGGEQKQPGDKITITEETYIYAIWEDIPVVKYNVSFNANGGSGTMLDETEQLGGYILPECGFTAPAGKQFKAWAEGSASGTQYAVGYEYDVTANVTFYAVWENIPVTNYTITATAGANGTISPSGEVIVAEGENKTFTITANSGYHIKDVKINGASVGAVSTYTFNDVAANATITVEFEVDTVPHVCNPTLVPKVEPNCTTAGKSAYYHCECGKNYEDAQGNSVISNLETWGILNALGHEAQDVWSTDGEYHWHKCTRCEEQLDKAAHSGGTATCTEKAVCATCNIAYGNTISHSHGSEWKTDANNHWNECACGDKANVAPHADEDNDGKCDTCDYAMGTPENPSENIESEKTGLSGGAIAGIAVGSVAVAGLGGFSLFWFVIKKKKFADLIALFKKK